MYGLFNFSSLKWRVDSRLNTTYKLVIVWNVTLDLELAWTTEVPFFFRLGYVLHWVF